MTESAELKDLERRMQSAIETLKKEFTGLRTGRASVNLLDPIVVDAYGQRLPLKQVGNVSAPEPRMLSVSVWDKGLVVAVQKAIRDAGLGLNPMAEGQLVRIPLPELTQDRRKELAKVAHKYAEQSKIAIRNVRRDGMEAAKKAEKDGKLTQDQHRRLSEDVQKLTDKLIKLVDETLAHKEKDIMQV